MYYIYRHKKGFIFFIGLQVIGLALQAQNMNDPYSIYGIGDIDKRIYNRTSGMAGTGLALKSSGYLIDNNPAGISGLPRSFFSAQVSVTGRSSSFSGAPITAINSKNKDMWIKRLALAVKINSFWASSIGMGQFSNINYKLTGSKTIEGANSIYDTQYEGDGSINEYYWTNAVSLGKHLSIGVKSSIIAGSINQSEILSDEVLQSVISTGTQDYIGKFRFQAGIIYDRALNKHWNISIGGRYVPKTKFDTDRTTTVTENGTSVLKQDQLLRDHLSLPRTMAGGIAIRHNNKTTYVADYTFEDWSSLGVKEQGWQLINSHRVSAGAEFSKTKAFQNQQVERRFFQLGAYYDRSYLQIRNVPINEYGITGGMGGAIGNGLLYSLSLDAGVRGTKKANLIKETYIGFTLNLSYSDFLMSKGRKYN